MTKIEHNGTVHRYYSLWPRDLVSRTLMEFGLLKPTVEFCLSSRRVWSWNYFANSAIICADGNSVVCRLLCVGYGYIQWKRYEDANEAPTLRDDRRVARC